MIIKSDVDNLERRDENENYVEILKKRRNNFSRWMAFFLLASHVDRARLFECLVSGEKEKAWNTKACISSSQLLFPLFFFLLLRFFCRLRRKGTKERPRSFLSPYVARQDEEATELFDWEREAEEEEAQNVEREEDEEKMRRKK